MGILSVLPLLLTFSGYYYTTTDAEMPLVADGGGAITATSSTKVAMKSGLGKAASPSVKTVLKYATAAGMVADAAQFGLELTGHEEIGKTVGMWGSIGTGAVAGAATGGPVGASLGALGGFGTWVIGEVIGEIL